MRKSLAYKGRSVWKGLYIPLKYNKILNKRTLIIQKRDINEIYDVHNGHGYKSVKINKQMLGFKLGQFVLTKIMGNKIHRRGKKKREKKKMNLNKKYWIIKIEYMLKISKKKISKQIYKQWDIH